MKPSYALLASANLLLLALTAACGFLVDGQSGWPRHFLLGVLSGLFTCFVHVIFFTYFMVQEKIFAQAILHHDLDPSHHARVRAHKLRALLLSLAGILTILATSGLGAAVGIYVPTAVHSAAALAGMATSAVVFYAQYALLGEHRGLFRDAFGE